MKHLKSFQQFESALPTNVTLEIALAVLQDTIYKYEPKENTKYAKKGYLRFVDTYGSSVLYINKNTIVLMYAGLNSHRLNCENKSKYDGTATGLLAAVQNDYNYYRFKREYYPELGRKYSLKDGSYVDKPKA